MEKVKQETITGGVWRTVQWFAGLTGHQAVGESNQAPPPLLIRAAPHVSGLGGGTVCTVCLTF